MANNESLDGDLLNVGKYAETTASFAAMTKLDPSNSIAFEDLAWCAERAWKWQDAVEYWDNVISRHPPEQSISAILRKAFCLSEMGSIEKSNAIYRSLATSVETLEGLARLATVHDTPNSAAQAWEALVFSYPNAPIGFLGKAEFLLSRDAFDEADTILNDIRSRWPNDYAATVLSSRCASIAKRWDLATKRWFEALKMFPDAVEVQQGVVQNLAALGENQSAIEFIASLKNDVSKAQCEVKFHLASDNYGQAIRAARSLVVLQRGMPEHQLDLARLLMRHGAYEALHAARWLLEDLHATAPRAVRVTAQLAEVYVRLSLEMKAERTIKSIPLDDRRAEVETLRAWTIRRRNLDESRRIWNSILDRNYAAAIHAPIHNLERIDSNHLSIGPRDVLLFSVVRNEMKRIPWFLAYYRKLGVEKFFIVDNGSTDGGVDYLLNCADVALYQTSDRYSVAGAGMRWVNELIDRHGRNNWCLHVDADEAFIYPNHERTSLPVFTERMRSLGDEAMLVSMLDMYPDNLKSTKSPKTAEQTYRFFDNQFHMHGYPICPYCEITGGVRYRLFDGYQLLNKVPLIDGAAGIKFILSSHRITPARISSTSGALLHFHLSHVLQSEAKLLLDDAINRREFPSNALERLRSRVKLIELEKMSSLLCAESVAFVSSQQLTELGVIGDTSKLVRPDRNPD